MNDITDESGEYLDKLVKIFISQVNISRETLGELGYSEVIRRLKSGAANPQPRSPHVALLPVFPLTSNPSSKK